MAVCSGFRAELNRAEPELAAAANVYSRWAKAEEAFMPVLLLWAVPAVIVVGGAGYWLIHMH